MLNGIAKELWDKQASGQIIHPQLYRHTATRLMEAVYDGLGANAFTFNEPNNELAACLQQNIHAFSAAKSLYQMRHFANLMARQDGSIRSFEAFRNKVHDAGYVFNHSFLQTEYNTALASAQMASQWQQYKQQDTQWLEYSTVGDNRVRPEHAALDGFTAKLTDHVWSTIYPPNGFNCRCSVVPGTEAGQSRVVLPDSPNWQKDYKISKYFQRNSGQTRAVFDEEIPVYKIGDKGPRQLLAIDHYGMKSVKQILDTEDWPAPKGFQNSQDALDWWKKLAGGKNDYVMPTGAGFEVKIPYAKIKHVIFDNEEKRYEFVGELQNILSHPHEIWSIRNKGKVEYVFLKYFDSRPVVVRVDAQMNMYTLHDLMHNKELNTAEATNLRSGNLILRK